MVKAAKRQESLLYCSAMSSAAKQTAGRACHISSNSAAPASGEQVILFVECPHDTASDRHESISSFDLKSLSRTAFLA